jgi:hypothetical protein
MPRRAVQNIRNAGALRRGVPGTNAGPADEILTASTILATGIVWQANNNGTIVERTYGDGRKWFPVQAVPPPSILAGQYWIETIAGTDYWCYVDSANNKKILAPDTLVGPINLINATPVVVDTFAQTAGLTKWLISIVDGSGSYLGVEVLAATTGINTVDYQIYSPTSVLTHIITVTRAVAVTSLQITAAGLGYAASARRITQS